MSSEVESILSWNLSLEQYLVDTAEKCMGYAWIHKQAETMYSRRTIFIDLPTIIIGAVNGFISVGSKQIFQEDAYAPVYIGMVSLFVSLLNTISSYFSWGRRAESHKLASNSYSRLSRMIYVEMNTKPRTERMQPHKLLEYVQGNYNSLCENSPLIPQPIVKLFTGQFSGLKDFSLPEETNGLHSISVYRDIQTPMSTPRLSKNLGYVPPALDQLSTSIKEKAPTTVEIISPRNVEIEMSPVKDVPGPNDK